MEPAIAAAHPGRRRSAGTLVARGVRRSLGLGIGVVTAAADLVILAPFGALLLLSAPWPRGHRVCRRLAADGVTGLVDLELRRLALWFDCDIRPEGDMRRYLEYLGIRVPLGLLTGYVMWLALVIAALFFAGAVWDQATGSVDLVRIELPWVGITTDSRLIGLFFGVVVLGLIAAGVAVLSGVECRLALRLLGPSEQERLLHRISELTESRAGVVHAVDEERRRIERDLHDGVQQRVVALAMLLGRARRGSDPERAVRLVGQAHEESQRLAEEVREVAWRVYPKVLDELGLDTALTELAERAGIPVAVTEDLSARPVRAVETAVYFIVREAVANAVKHAQATRVTVDIADDDARTIAVRVGDDGHGGAALVAGGGLSGLARRAAALDGRFELHSPQGGPTVVTVRLPRGAPADADGTVPGDMSEGQG